MNAAREIHQAFQNGKRWIKGDYDRGYSMCLVGAIGLLFHEGVTLNEEIEGDPVAIALADIIREQYPDRGREAPLCCVDCWSPNVTAIIDFNDHEDTTWRDVDRVLEKLAVKLEEM